MISPRPLSTEDLAHVALVTPASIRVRLCRTGSYFGLQPVKLPNGRLAWPHDSEKRLTAIQRQGEVA
jgi:hypothetical protein